MINIAVVVGMPDVGVLVVQQVVMLGAAAAGWRAPTRRPTQAILACLARAIPRHLPCESDAPL